MSFWVSCRMRGYRIRARSAEQLASHVVRQLGYSQVDLNLTFVGDATMRRLNRRYRGRDTSTDVLAFALDRAPQPRTPVTILGDVVVAVPTARRQAKTAGHSLDRELTLLIVHGILHLCGYDHERTPLEARRMFRKQRDLLGTIARAPRLLTSLRT